MADFLQGVLPNGYTSYVLDCLVQVLSPYTYFNVQDYESNSNANKLYVAVQTYLSYLTRERARSSNVAIAKNKKNITFSMENRQQIRDTFKKVTVEWMHTMEERRNSIWADLGENERNSDEICQGDQTLTTK